jgi:hypothetical protein
MSLNYLRFDNPLESGYGYTEQTRQDELQFVYPHGLFDISYVERHPPGHGRCICRVGVTPDDSASR